MAIKLESIGPDEVEIVLDLGKDAADQTVIFRFDFQASMDLDTQLVKLFGLAAVKAISTAGFPAPMLKFGVWAGVKEDWKARHKRALQPDDVTMWLKRTNADDRIMLSALVLRAIRRMNGDEVPLLDPPEAEDPPKAGAPEGAAGEGSQTPTSS